MKQIILIILLIITVSLAFSQNQQMKMENRVDVSRWMDMKKGKNVITTVMFANSDVNEKNEIVKGNYRVCSYVNIGNKGIGKHIIFKFVNEEFIHPGTTYNIPHRDISIYGDSFRIKSINGYNKIFNKKKISNGSLQGNAEVKLSKDSAIITFNIDKLDEYRENISFKIKKQNLNKFEITIPDIHAEFPGGVKGFILFIEKNIIYPQEAIKTGIQGTVFTDYIIDRDGRVSHAKILRGIGGGSDEEVLRVIHQMPQWEPAKVEGVKVKEHIKTRFRFIISNGGCGSSDKDEIKICYMMPTLNRNVEENVNKYRMEEKNGVIKEYQGNVIVRFDSTIDKTTRIVKEYYKNANIESIYTYKNHRSDGKQREWWENGNKRFEGEYKDNTCIGIHYYYMYDNGTIEKVIDYKKHKFKKFDKEGKIKTEGRFNKRCRAKGKWRYYKNGVIFEKVRVRDGWIKGKRKIYEEKTGKYIRTKKYNSKEWRQGEWIPCRVVELM